MANSDFSIALRNYAGVPVVELVGEINQKTLATLEDILGRLMQAGHYNVMINLKRAVWQSLNALTSLEKAAKLFRTHYGHLDIIAETEQIDKLLGSTKLANLFRFCTSEGQALTRIKKVPVTSTGGVRPTSARLAKSL